MIADVGDTIPERTPEVGPNRRVREAMYPGDFTDVAAINDQLIAVNRSGKQLVVFDPALSTKATLDLLAAARLTSFAHPTDENQTASLSLPNCATWRSSHRGHCVVGGGISDGNIIVVDIPTRLAADHQHHSHADGGQESTSTRRSSGCSRDAGGAHMIDLSHPPYTGTVDRTATGGTISRMETDHPLGTNELNGIRQRRWGYNRLSTDSFSGSRNCRASLRDGSAVTRDSAPSCDEGQSLRRSGSTAARSGRWCDAQLSVLERGAPVSWKANSPPCSASTSQA
jgi:hypothetical protein